MSNDDRRPSTLFPDLKGDPATCLHRECDLVRNIISSGASQLWMRCRSCGANRAGGGHWLPHQRAFDRLEDVPVVHDYRHEVPPCARCGALGTELHHWYPRALDGDEEADRWPTAWLCVAHHNLFHVRIIQAALAGKLGHAPAIEV